MPLVYIDYVFTLVGLESKNYILHNINYRTFLIVFKLEVNNM